MLKAHQKLDKSLGYDQIAVIEKHHILELKNFQSIKY